MSFLDRPPVKRFIYPRFVGGPSSKKKTLNYPRDMTRIRILRHRQQSPAFFRPMDSFHPAEIQQYEEDLYVKHRAAFGRERVVEFWAHSRLTGEAAADQLFDDMLSRCGARRES